MTDDLFISLAMKVLSGEASLEDRKALDHLCLADPSLKGELDRLKETFDLLRASRPLDDLYLSKEPALPAYRLQELRAAVRQEFPKKEKTENVGWWKMNWLQAGSYAGCVLTVLLLGAFLLNQRNGIEFGTYQDQGMRDGLNPQQVSNASIQAFASDEGFQTWQKSRFGPRFRVWFDEAQDRIVVVESGGLFSANKTVVHPLPESNAERESALKKILAGLKNP